MSRSEKNKRTFHARLVLRFTEQRKALVSTAAEDCLCPADYLPITSWHPLRQQGQSQLGNKGCNEIYFFFCPSGCRFIFASCWLSQGLYVTTCARARLRTCAGVHKRARVLTSAAQVLLVDLDHELPINISKHATVHPVRHKPEEERGKKSPDSDFQVRCLSPDFRGQSHLSQRHNCRCVRTDRV